ncbi:Uma2 family endonuclease [Streptomyces sp. NPDC052773]|uniref:Uma2 family endonuclease n=1 Tax=Streptomyces sp. NPDC052773 TaxID=3365693 RepID=UPI0037D0C5BF
MDRPRAQLARFQDAFPGYRTEIVEGNVVACPLRPSHARTIYQIWSRLEPQLDPEWSLISDVAIPFAEDFEFCPDLAVIPAAEQRRNLISYPPDLVELVVEVVSSGSVRHDYEVKDRHYAGRGIPNYLILDPLRGHVSTMWNPGTDGYRGRDVVPYGPEVAVESPVGRLMIRTDGLPVDPKASHPS